MKTLCLYKGIITTIKLQPTDSSIQGSSLACPAIAGKFVDRAASLVIPVLLRLLLAMLPSVSTPE